MIYHQKYLRLRRAIHITQNKYIFLDIFWIVKSTHFHFSLTTSQKVSRISGQSLDIFNVCLDLSRILFQAYSELGLGQQIWQWWTQARLTSSKCALRAHLELAVGWTQASLINSERALHTICQFASVLRKWIFTHFLLLD